MNLFLYIIYKLKSRYADYCFWHISPIVGKNAFLRNCDKVGENLRVLGGVSVRKATDGYLSIGNDFFCQSGALASIDVQAESKIQIESGAKLFIGDNVGFSSIIIHCWKHISIGNNVAIGAGCMIFDTNFHNTDPSLRSSGDPRSKVNTKSIIIGDNVFVGTRCIITKGVTIGNNSIIAAGSVVVCNIPPNEVWGGAPAKFIKKTL